MFLPETDLNVPHKHCRYQCLRWGGLGNIRVCPGYASRCIVHIGRPVWGWEVWIPLLLCDRAGCPHYPMTSRPLGSPPCVLYIAGVLFGLRDGRHAALIHAHDGRMHNWPPSCKRLVRSCCTSEVCPLTSIGGVWARSLQKIPPPWRVTGTPARVRLVGKFYPSPIILVQVASIRGAPPPYLD